MDHQTVDVSGESSSDESEPEDLAITLLRHTARVFPASRQVCKSLLLRVGVSKLKVDNDDEEGGAGKLGWSPARLLPRRGVAKRAAAALTKRSVRQKMQSMVVVLVVAGLIILAVGGARNAIHKRVMKEREKEVRLRVAMEMENLKQRERDKVLLEKMKSRMKRQHLPPSWGMEDAHFVDRTNHKKFVLGKGWVEWHEPVPKTQEQINLEKLQTRFRDDGIEVRR